MNIDDYWRERPVARFLMFSLTGLVIVVLFVFMAFYSGATRVEAVLRERAELSGDQDVVLKNTGAFVGRYGSVRRGSRLWCGWVEGMPHRRIAAWEGRLRRGNRDFGGSALGWAPRSEEERRMLAQCAERLGPPGLP